jgi:hypothetical protein
LGTNATVIISLVVSPPSVAGSSEEASSVVPAAQPARTRAVSPAIALTDITLFLTVTILPLSLETVVADATTVFRVNLFGLTTL